MRRKTSFCAAPRGPGSDRRMTSSSRFSRRWTR
ncbi:hypothetical protein EYF80_065314 [Liparis tanakae]|uniref:Uncharacterized protein n=1 Tax=Liparis tanakae TaxID=230148 RepID=A0A4Z2E7L3_9TELE|nr:hypothetical protein EYF80_065314 [Liparis tanakae]